MKGQAKAGKAQRWGGPRRATRRGTGALIHEGTSGLCGNARLTGAVTLPHSGPADEFKCKAFNRKLNLKGTASFTGAGRPDG